MQSKLQELTEKLYNEGITKANEDAVQIIDNAKKEAEKIIKDANVKAESIIEKANNKSAEMAKNTESELKLSSKQAINALKQEITQLLASGTIGNTVKDTFKEKEFIKSLISTIVKNWNPRELESIDLLLVLPESDKKTFHAFVESKLKSLLDGEIIVKFDNRLKNGFKIGPSDGSYTLSFSDEDFENFFKAYLRPRTAKLLYGEE